MCTQHYTTTMSALLRLAIFVLAIIGQSLGQVIFAEQCPVVPSQPTFDVSKYLGLWYEIEKLPNIFEEGQCIRARYALKDNGRVEVFNRYIENGTEHTALGEAYVPDPTKPAVLSVRFNMAAPAAEYKVVETDYNTYSLVYSCSVFLNIFKTEFIWILSRTTTLNSTLLTQLEHKIGSYTTGVSKLQKTVQTNCPL